MSGYSLPLRLGPDLIIIALLFQTLRLGSLQPQKPRLFSAPFAILFCIHVLWALVEFCNPYSIGLDSSLAGYKVYVSSLLLYFIAYKAVEKEADLNQFSWCILGVLTTQVVVAAYQFQLGEAGLVKWSSLYTAALGVQFHGLFFRPFGFSNVPGGASTFIYILAPLSVNLLIRQKKLWSLIFCTVLLGGMGYVLFICQIRAALIKCAVGLGIFLVFMALRSPKVFIPATAAMLLGIFSFSLLIGMNDPKLEVARKRVEALSNIQTVWKDRSEGTYDSTLRIVTEQPLGIGLSRVGAASAPFKDRIVNDQRYGVIWSFADNLYKALLIEVGVPGLIFFILFLGAVSIRAIWFLLVLWRDPTVTTYAWMTAATAGVFATYLGHIGSEGFLYQPEAGLVWLLLGAVLKSGSMSFSSKNSTV